MTTGKLRAFVCAPNRSMNPFRTENVAVGVIVIYGNGVWDYEFKTVDDQFEVLTTLEVVNWDNPEVADYIRERMDRPQSCAFWEVETKDGDTLETVYQRFLDADKE